MSFCLALSVKAQPILTEDAKLVGSSSSSDANAGWSIAAADGFVVLGAFADESTPTTGAAYVFRETADGWEKEAKIEASQESFFSFGFSVSAWSNSREEVCIVGAQGNSLQPETDAAYIFRRTADTEWIEEARLTNSLEEYESFGRAVAVHGDYVIVGAPGADDAGGTTGAAYVFRRTSDGVWVEDARLLASDLSMKAGFGRGVSLIVSSEGVPFALIGAPSDNDQRGAAYAFRRTPDGAWVEEIKLVERDPEPDTGGLFGLGVALAETPSGEILALAGEVGDQGSGIQSGAGYVFRRASGGTWVFEQKLTAADGQSGQRLGWSVAISAAPEVDGTVAVLGGDGAYNFAGTVRLFLRTTAGTEPVWTEEAELWADDRAPGQRIGHSVGASARYAIAGAPYNGNGRGAGYVWDLQRAVPVEPAPLVIADRAELVAYPNPAAGPISLRLSLPRAAHVRLDVYDMLGREVAVLHDGLAEAGRHRFVLDTVDLPAGTYLVRATAAGPRGSGQAYTEPFTVVN